ncbi:nucleotidyltransferase domain-containing protein [Streptomyces sp. 3MP-14]|uniref:Nucleotidyltransferase domain-containing protein n=1 Tax=Streptomyces mimosae TaxID=2586635 RepID=A0A5N6A269_9ACTN|nr:MULTISPECIES: nucleotidyltransferase domain-containing protein [Streptomyces]KAB8162864.1 nucleotidyltransferase domain-containing protein [Streptomyces mimosae]KAB8179077.1 nucleotidyltransferase domain-containing protein [Streptomyces sp. 3MP-14]
MFTAEQRAALRERLVAEARRDPAIGAAALVGSAAGGREDRWSDIDLALALAPGADRDAVVAAWSALLYEDHGAVAHLDVWAGGTLYRVFLLPSTLQVDVSFWAAEEFRARGPEFRLLFGAAGEPAPAAPPAAGELVGWGWLYALHARTSIARGRLWQAEYMVSGVRERALALACLRHGLPAAQGRGMDELPADVTGPLAGALVRALERGELVRALGVACAALLREAAAVDAGLAGRLAAPLAELADPPEGAPAGG